MVQLFRYHAERINFWHFGRIGGWVGSIQLWGVEMVLGSDADSDSAKGVGHEWHGHRQMSCPQRLVYSL
jgi:hypothetical protein